MLAGAAEAAIAVTPSETIKTRLIDDARKAQPRFNGAAHGLSLIVREEGVVGIYRGLMPTIMKQSANSAVRFTCKLQDCHWRAASTPALNMPSSCPTRCQPTTPSSLQLKASLGIRAGSQVRRRSCAAEGPA